MSKNCFHEDLQMSFESCQLETDEKTLRNYFKFVESVEKTDIDIDKSGINYWVNLLGGRKIGVDVKTRRAGTRAYWEHGEPEMTIEIWSQVWSDNRNDPRNKRGWTVDYRKQCEYVMYKFDPAECTDVFIYPFEQLLKTTRKHMNEWATIYGLKDTEQGKSAYITKCIYVPASVVGDCIKADFRGDLILPEQM